MAYRKWVFILGRPMWKWSYRKKCVNGLLPPLTKTVVHSHTAPGSCHVCALDSLCWEPNTMHKLCGDKQRPLPHVHFSVGYHDCLLSPVIHIHNSHTTRPTETVFLCPGPSHWELKNHPCEVSKHPQVWGRTNDAIIPCVCVFTNVFTHVQVHVSECMGTGGGQRPTWSVRNYLFVFVTGLVE